jgi:hypothetical protein
MMRIRIYEVARTSDVPSGFTKLVDFVEIGVLP